MEVFVPVRVEVRVRVEVACPGAETVGEGIAEGEARGEAVPPTTAVPVGVGAAVVTSRYSTDSTRVTVGTLTLT